MKFDNIIGNTEIKDYLRKSIDNNNILHSYLFLGTEGIGKLTIAKEFAKYILCLENKEVCNCKSCICFDGNNHPDFNVINEIGETIKIDQVRELISKIIEKPIVSNRKVYIINDSEKITKEAQNCLLKTLEEPPEFVTIILVSSNENLILNTIKSRCMKIKFKNIEDKELYNYGINNLGYDEISENLLKTFDGSIGKAQNLKENREIYSQVDMLISKMKTEDIISIFLDSKFMYNKDKVFEILDYLMVCLFSKVAEDKRYLDCIKITNDCINKLKSNANLDMNIDSLLFNIWRNLNEKNYRN